MPALKSNNPLEAKINKHFVVKIRNPMDRDWRLTTARKLSNSLQDEQIKLRLFQEVLEGAEYVYLFSIRNRLKIKFTSR